MSDIPTRIIACLHCGQQNRVPSDGITQGRWRCAKCHNDLQAEPAAAQSAKSAPRTARETRLEFSWGVVLKNLSIAGGIVAAGVALAYLGESGGYVIGGGILALLGVILFFVLGFQGLGGVGSCPICSAEIVALSSNESYMLCPGCREYLSIRDKVISQMDPASIASEPKFAVPTPWEDLKAITLTPVGSLVTGGEVRELHATWPNACCVCGESASRLEDRAFEVYKWNGDMLRVNQTKMILRVAGVPYCATHSKGVGIENVNFQSKGDDTDIKQDLVFTFRSYAYRNRVLELNRWPWR